MTFILSVCPHIYQFSCVRLSWVREDHYWRWVITKRFQKTHNCINERTNVEFVLCVFILSSHAIKRAFTCKAIGVEGRACLSGHSVLTLWLSAWCHICLYIYMRNTAHLPAAEKRVFLIKMLWGRLSTVLFDPAIREAWSELFGGLEYAGWTRWVEIESSTYGNHYMYIYIAIWFCIHFVSFIIDLEYWNRLDVCLDNSHVAD